MIPTLFRYEEEQKRKSVMINFRRSELKKLKGQSKKLGLVTDSDITVTNFMALVKTAQGAASAIGAASDLQPGESSAVDKTTNTMMKMHKLYVFSTL